MDSTLDNLVAKSIRDNKAIGHVAHSTVLEIVEYARQLETRTCPACEAAARELAEANDEIARLRTLKDAEPGQWNAALELADLRARLEALADEWSQNARDAMLDGDNRAADETEWYAQNLRALLRKEAK